MALFPSAITYSDTYDFAPSVGDIILTAFGRIGVRPTEITTEQMRQSLIEMNLLQAKLSNQQPNLWTVVQNNDSLVQGTATYTVPTQAVMITNAFIRVGSGATASDTIIFPISQTEYAALPNKATQAKPTQFWFNRILSPTITLYPTPDGNGPYTLYYYYVRQVQDSKLPSGLNPDIPYLWLDALVAGLAYRLARLYRPDLEVQRKADADEAWVIAAEQNVENVNLYISPDLSGYYR